MLKFVILDLSVWFFEFFGIYSKYENSYDFRYSFRKNTDIPIISDSLLSER